MAAQYVFIVAELATYKQAALKEEMSNRNVSSLNQVIRQIQIITSHEIVIEIIPSPLAESNV